MRSESEVKESAESSALKVGELLRQVRQNKGLSLEEVSRQTRLRLIHVRALEEGELGQLPGQTFVVGFLRIYARHLGLQEEEVVQRFMAEMKGRNGKLSTPFFPPPPSTSRSRPSRWMVVMGLLLLLAAGVAVERWYWDREGSESPPRSVPEASGPVNRSEKSVAPVTGGGEVEGSKRVTETMTVPLTREVVSLPEENRPASQELREKAVRGETASGEESGKVWNFGGDPPEPPAGVDEEEGAGGESGKLVLLATQKVWLQVKDGRGHVVRDATMRPGERYEVPEGSGYTLSLGNAGGLQFRVGEGEAVLLGRTGEVVRGMPLTVQALRERAARH
ncbi:MAG: helix-turn-helix domain-containing protein [Magnetococcales bacterium]|nr:helix-turn-helix domain-containing protein [Magnetococcales bacterium]